MRCLWLLAEACNLLYSGEKRARPLPAQVETFRQSRVRVSFLAGAVQDVGTPPGRQSRVNWQE